MVTEAALFRDSACLMGMSAGSPESRRLISHKPVKCFLHEFEFFLFGFFGTRQLSVSAGLLSRDFPLTDIGLRASCLALISCSRGRGKLKTRKGTQRTIMDTSGHHRTHNYVE